MAKFWKTVPSETGDGKVWHTWTDQLTGQEFEIRPMSSGEWLVSVYYPDGFFEPYAYASSLSAAKAMAERASGPKKNPHHPRRSGTDDANHSWFDRLVSMPLAEARKIVEKRSRSHLLEWLQWNDPNGSYSDEMVAHEDYDPLTKEEAVEILMAVVKDERV